MNTIKTRVFNTKACGIVHFVYLTNEKGTFGICLDFNIVEEGTNEAEVHKHLETAVALHIETVREKNLSDELLNRLAPEKYWEIYDDFHAKESIKRKGETSRVGVEGIEYTRAPLGVGA